MEGFYKTAKEDEAMQIVLFFLPGILYRLPEMVNDLLDLGAGNNKNKNFAKQKFRSNSLYTNNSQKTRQKHFYIRLC